MTHLRLLVPVVVDFGIVPGAASRDPEGYASLWTRLAQRFDDASALPAGTTLSVHHTTRVRSVNQYSRIDEDSLGRPLHVLTLTGDAAALTARTGTDLTITSAELALYDHGVALLEIGVDAGAVPASDTASWLDGLQAGGVALAEQLARQITTQALDPVLAVARGLDPEHEVVEAPLQEDDPALADLGEALWVSRSLLVAPADRGALAHWTKDVVGGEDEQLRSALLDGDSDRLVRWLNYAFVDVDGEGSAAFARGRFADHWQGLRYAQMTYAVLDRIDSRLALVLAEAAAATERWQLEALRQSLVALSGRAEVAIIERQHLAKYLKRSVRVHMVQTLEGWDYAELLEGPVQFKIEACGRRLDDLTSKRTARSGFITDLILLGIGVTSIASTSLAIIDFGRASATDPISTGYDLGGSDFTSWFAAQPIDAVLLVSGVLSVILVLLYMYFRRDDRG